MMMIMMMIFYSLMEVPKLSPPAILKMIFLFLSWDVAPTQADLLHWDEPQNNSDRLI